MIRTTTSRITASVVAYVLAFGQAMPLASASYYLRPEATGDSGTAGETLREAPTWVWGPAGVDPITTLGRENLTALGKRVVSRSFDEGRAFALVGPGSKPIAELVENWAAAQQRRQGSALGGAETVITQAQKYALAKRLDDIKAAIERQLAYKQVALESSFPFHNRPVLSIVRVVVVLDDANNPVLVSEGVRGTATHRALIAYGGAHKWDGWQDDVPADLQALLRNEPRTIYLSLAQLEGLNTPERQGAQQKLLAHEIDDVIRQAHEDEEPAVQDEINGAITQVVTAFEAAREKDIAALQKARKEAAAKEAKKLATRVQITPYLMDLGRFYEGGRVPDYVMAALQARVTQAARARQITDAYVKRFNGHVLLEVHSNGPERNPQVDRLIVDLVSDIIPTRSPSPEGAVAMLGTYAKEISGKPYDARANALRIRTGELGFNERSAEPVYVSVALGGGPAAYNWVIMRLLNEAAENQLKIEGIRQEELDALRKEYERYRKVAALGDEALAKDLEFNKANLSREAEMAGPGYVVVVERVADILAGKREREVCRFVFPTHLPYLHTLVDDQTEWVITKVLPRPGSRMYDVSRSPDDQEPVLAVMVDQIGNVTQDGDSFNPVFVARQQSGAPAIGEFVSATTQFYLTTSGPGAGTLHRGVMPTTFEEADAGTFAEQGMVQMVSYTYQEYANGRIPEREVHDQVALSSDVRGTREDERFVHDHLLLLGSFEPGVTAPEAERRADHTVEVLGARYHEIPAVIQRGADGKPRLGADGKALLKLDPILEASNTSQVVTVSDLKADIGATGHQRPYSIHYAAFRASLKAAKKQGLIDNFDLTNAGDDNHFIMFHHHGVDSPIIHTLAWNTFFRAGWLIHNSGLLADDVGIEGFKVYGDMQDLVQKEVRELIKQRRLHTQADLNDDFMEALEEELRGTPDEEFLPKIREAYARAQAGTSVATEARADYKFPGNVGGAGIGFAEKTLSAAELVRSPNWSVVFNDKGAAGAFNYPAYWGLRLVFLMKQHGLGSALHTALLQELTERMPDVPVQLCREYADQLYSEVTAKFSAHLTSVEQFGRVDASIAPTAVVVTPLEELEAIATNGLVVESWDVLPNSRAFLDVERDDAALLWLMGATNEHNIKRIWTKKRAGWLSDLTPEEIAAIESRVDAELPGLQPELEARKAQITHDVDAHKKNPKEGRSLDQLNPYERALHVQTVDAVMADMRSRMIELYKVREFLGDDYIASVSTEKLAAVTGGEYVGKDDSVMIAVEPFLMLYRAISKFGPRISIGNARGSHKVETRLEGGRTRVPGTMTPEVVAVKWSNPIEGSLKFAIGQNGVVETHAETGLANGVDMYGRAEYDESRARVIRWNEAMIGAQGGFTPHGPNVDRDVEAAYPARKTRNSLVRKGSPFVRSSVDETASQVQQGAWTSQFPTATSHVVTPELAQVAADTTTHRWIVINSAVFANGPDAAIALQRVQDQLAMVLRQGLSAVHFALAVNGATTPDDARARSVAIFAAMREASKDAAILSAENFEAVLPADLTPEQLLGDLAALKPKSQVASLIGPAAWAQPVHAKCANPATVALVAFDPTPAEAKVASGASAIIAGIEAVATDGKLSPAVAGKLNALTDASGVIATADLDVTADVRDDLRAYQDRTRAVATAGTSG